MGGTKMGIVALLLLAAGLGSAAAPPHPREPDCSGPDNWAANMTVATLKNAGILAQNARFGPVQVRQILSQRLSKDLYRQAFRIVIRPRGASPVIALTISDASFEECSMAEPKVYVVAKEL